MSGRAIASKVCYALALIVFLASVFGWPLGLLSGVPLGLAFVAAGLLLA